MEGQQMNETKLNGQSMDIVADNIQKLKNIFPEVFCEDSIDFEKLQAVLGNYIDTDSERYNFTWWGKSQALRLAQTPSTGTLRPCKEESKDWDTTQNLYIEGDNLEVLKLLQKTYHDKVKMIYIDPPYNTGKDFVYPDDYKDNLKNYLEITGQIDVKGNKITTNSDTSGRYHTNWLNMIYPRLKLARNLLMKDGVIFISIDDKEVDNLKKVCNELFGEDNFVGCLILQTATDNNPGQINTEHEYMLCYAKNIDQLEYWFAESDKAKLINEKYIELKDRGLAVEDIQAKLRKWIKQNKDGLEGVTHYDNVDEKGVFHDGDVANTVFGGYSYEVIHPITGKACKVPDKGFRFPEETMRVMIANGDIMFGNDETTLIKPKKRIENAKDILRTMVYEDGRTSTKQFESLMARDIFQNPKSPNVLSRVIRFVVKEDDIVLDFFSGSGTIAEAVMNVNVEKNLKLRYILVQLPEDLDQMLMKADSRSKKTIQNAINFLDSINKRHTIAEIGKERIRRVRSTLKNSGEPNIDLGIKVFKLDTSNIKKWSPDYDNLEQTLFDQINNFVEGRTELDVVFEIMLKYGIDLTFPIEKYEITGKKVYSVGFGALIICLDNDITTDLAMGIIKLKEELTPDIMRVVFKDNGFKNDSVKTNVREIFKVNGIDEIVSI